MPRQQKRQLPPHVLEYALHLRSSGSSAATIQSAVFRTHGVWCGRQWWTIELFRRTGKFIGGIRLPAHVVERVQALRKSGSSYSEVAETVRAEFGITRTRAWWWQKFPKRYRKPPKPRKISVRKWKKRNPGQKSSPRKIAEPDGTPRVRGRHPIELPVHVMSKARELRREGRSCVVIQAMIFREFGMLPSVE